MSRKFFQFSLGSSPEFKQGLAEQQQQKISLSLKTLLEEEGEDMDAKGALKLGDPVFAEVKGWLPYPARIIGVEKKSKKLKFSVLFYRTKETGEIWSENLWSVSPATVKKMVTSKTFSSLPLKK